MKQKRFYYLLLWGILGLGALYFDIWELYVYSLGAIVVSFKYLLEA